MIFSCGTVGKIFLKIFFSNINILGHVQLVDLKYLSKEQLKVSFYILYLMNLTFYTH
jgi:hypothetical protein